MKLSYLGCVVLLSVSPGANATGGSLSPDIGAANATESAAIRAGHADAETSRTMPSVPTSTNGSTPETDNSPGTTGKPGGGGK
jgi:hypothetical protein